LELLLDTHVFLWWEASDPRLSVVAAQAINDPANQVFVSAASVWEIATKRRTGKLVFAGSPSGAIGKNGFFELPILPMDAELAGDLVWDHRDPFDRLLVAQAMRLRRVLVTADAVVRGFEPVVTFWAG
jgi:PIN domain nuclease of toxin-antitoxin system